DIQLRSTRELIEKLIEENLPKIDNPENIEDELQSYRHEQKILAIEKLCQEEHLDKQQFNALIESYSSSGREPLSDEVYMCSDNRPSILKAGEIVVRILDKMREFVNVFINGMVG